MGKRKRYTNVAATNAALDPSRLRGTEKRFTVLTTQLECAMRGCENKKDLLGMFRDLSDRVGALRCVVSVVGNFIAIKRAEAGDHIQLPLINKSFYDQVWSAVDRRMKGLERGKASQYEAEVLEWARLVDVAQLHHAYGDFGRYR